MSTSFSAAIVLSAISALAILRRLTRSYNLNLVLRRATNLQAKRRFGLERENWRVLVLIGGGPPRTLGELGERTSLDTGQLSREVSALVSKGLVQRRRKWRHVFLSLSEAGQELYDRLMVDSTARNEFLLEGVPEADRKKVLEILDYALDRAKQFYEIEKALDRQDAGGE